MLSKEMFACNRGLLIINFLISFLCFISLSFLLLYLFIVKPIDSVSIQDSWNDNVEINKICNFNNYPVRIDDGTKYGQLRWIGALFRHGDRTPIWFLDNDPYKNYDWPEGNEMLTNIGKRRMFCYGVALKYRYKSYLENVKTPNVIAFSSWYRRTIETNELVLSGMFPPTRENSWAPTLEIAKHWQPIGVSSAEFARSWMLLDESKCLLAEKIQSNTQPILTNEQRTFMKNMSKLTNSSVQTVDDVYHIYDTLWIERAYFGKSFKEPSWIAKLGSDTWQKMKEIVDLSFNKLQFNNNYLRLRSGVFLNKLKEITKNITNSMINQSSMVHTFSSHDTTISLILQSLGLYKEPPPYGSGIVFELRQTNLGKYIMRLLYVDVVDNNKFTEFNLTTSKIFQHSCQDSICDHEKFFQILSDNDFLIKHENIENECNSNQKRIAFYEKPFFPKRK